MRWKAVFREVERCITHGGLNLLQVSRNSLNAPCNSTFKGWLILRMHLEIYICLDLLSVPVQRQNIQKDASLQRETSPLSITAEKKRMENFLPDLYRTRQLNSKFSSFFQNYSFVSKNVLPLPITYSSYYIFQKWPVSLSDAPHTTVSHTPPTSYSSPSKFIISHLLLCTVTARFPITLSFPVH